MAVVELVSVTVERERRVVVTDEVKVVEISEITVT